MSFREENKFIVRLLEVLEENGAGGPAGWQVKQDDLAPLVGFKDKRKLHPFLRTAKDHGLVTTTPNRIGSGWGSTIRQADTYHLHVTAAEWVEMVPGIVAKRTTVLRSKASATTRANNMETKRLVRLAKRMTPVQRATATAVPVDLEAARARAATYSDDDDFTGW